MSDTIILERRENAAVIRFNRPDVFNSFNQEMAFALQECLDECKTDENIRAVMIIGEGKAFCAGQDIKELMVDNPPPLSVIIAKHFNPIVKRIRTIEKPIIAAVNGIAAGAGANIALACDITIASESASFLQAFSKIGLIPDSGGTFMLPRLIGWQKASALMMLGEKIPAQEAERMGMIYKVFPNKTFEKAAFDLLDQLATMPTKGIALTKKALNYSFFSDLDKQLDIEEQLQSIAGQTEDYKEGIDAFIDKRNPVFKGQ